MKIRLFFVVFGFLLSTNSSLTAQVILRSVTYTLENGQATIQVSADRNLRALQKLDPEKDKTLQLKVEVVWASSAAKKYILLRPAHVSIKIDKKKKGSIKVIHEKFTISTPIVITFAHPYSAQQGEIIIDPHYLLNTENINQGKRAKGNVISIPYNFIEKSVENKPQKKEDKKSDSLKVKADSLPKKPSVFEISGYSVTPSWIGASNGMIELDIAGGERPYRYQVKALNISDTLHPEDSQIVLEELPAGVYEVEIYDHKGKKIAFKKEVKNVGEDFEQTQKESATEDSSFKIWISLFLLLALVIMLMYWYRHKISGLWQKSRINSPKNPNKSNNKQKSNSFISKITIRKRN